VKWFKTVLVLALVALWLPATLHCQLEELPGLQFLACCDHDETAPHQDDDCRTDSCAMVEDGLYKTNDSKVTAAPMVARLTIAPTFTLPTDPQSAGLEGHLATDKSPELPVTWQFSRRTALPPRAPSFVS
jgi:hypothetical protein